MERRPLSRTPIAPRSPAPRTPMALVNPRAASVKPATRAVNPKPRSVNPVKPVVAKVTERFVSTGGMMLDCVLSGNGEVGGWARGRIINIVGDSSTGKTLLAVEACANFSLIAPKDHIRYVEAEAAFDEDYGEVVGMPEGIHTTDNIRTVEEFFNDLQKFCDAQKKNPYPCLYVLDSLDALSDDAEMESKFGDNGYGTAKAKALSQAFRRITRDLSEANCTLIIVSQVRQKIGVMFGDKKGRSGGEALQFYATQIIWLAELGKIKRTVSGIERTIGIDIRVRNRKNKLGPAHREAEQTMLFGYGIDDETSMLKWLVKSKALTSATAWMDAVHEARIGRDRARLQQLNAELRTMVWGKWSEIEQTLAPPMRKYGV